MLEFIFFQSFFSRDLQRIANSPLNKDKSVLLPIFTGPGVLSTASDKAKLFSENFSKNFNLDDSCISLYLFLSFLESAMNTMKRVISLFIFYRFKSLLTLLIYNRIVFEIYRKKIFNKICQSLGLAPNFQLKDRTTKKTEERAKVIKIGIGQERKIETRDYRFYRSFDFMECIMLLLC